jgi:acetyl/propionyl-CoA carboxylase alpha subunit
LSFLKALLNHPAFSSQNFNTKFIEKNAADLLGKRTRTEENVAIAALGVHLQSIEGSLALAAKYNRPSSPFYSLGSFRLNLPSAKPLILSSADLTWTVKINHDQGLYHVQVNSAVYTLRVVAARGTAFTVESEGKKTDFVVVKEGKIVWLADGEGDVLRLEEVMPDIERTGDDTQTSKEVASPLPGKIIKISVKPGDQVKPGQVLVIIESMKMEHMLKASFAGVVESVYHKENDFVPSGKPVLRIAKA